MTDIAILTPIELEYEYISDLLKERRYFPAQFNERYETGIIQNTHRPLSAVITLSGSKTVDVALATTRIIERFNPKIILLAGIAGGVKDVNIGDLVVATKAYGYESGKEADNGFLVRPEVLPYDRSLIEFARLINRENKWKNPRHTTAGAQVFFGPIASGNKLIATNTGAVKSLLKTHYNDTTALEMEAIGFAKAVTNFRNTRAINVRGISDLLGDKSNTDRQGGQQRALGNLFAFLSTFFYQLNLSDFSDSAPDRSTQKSNSPQQSNPVTPTKNTINNSTISVGGNFHLGDK